MGRGRAHVGRGWLCTMVSEVTGVAPRDELGDGGRPAQESGMWNSPTQPPACGGAVLKPRVGGPTPGLGAEGTRPVPEGQ